MAVFHLLFKTVQALLHQEDRLKYGLKLTPDGATSLDHVLLLKIPDLYSFCH